MIQRGAPQGGKPLRREVDVIARTEQAVCASIADEPSHESSQVRLDGMEHLRLWCVCQRSNAPEPQTKINVLIVYMENVDSLLFTG